MDTQPPQLKEIYPSFEQYVSIRDVDGRKVIFDAVSDQLIAIQDVHVDLLGLCDGFHNLDDIFSKFSDDGHRGSKSDIHNALNRLRDLKVIGFKTYRHTLSAKVLLINPSLAFPKSRYAFQKIMPPLGLLHIAGQLLEEGHEVDILDMAQEDTTPADISAHLKAKSTLYDLIGISLNMTSTSAEALRIAQNIKDCFPDIPIIMGGNHATMTYQSLLKDAYADFVCIGMGERLMVFLCEALFAKKGKIEEIPGLAYKTGTQVRQNPLESQWQDLNELSFPAYQKIDLSRYDTNGYIPVVTSIGCPFNCAYCSTFKFHGRRVNYYAPQKVVDVLERLMENYGTNKFNFLDDAFTFNRKRIVAICELLIEKRLDIEWMCNTRIDMVDLDLLKLMGRAGCKGVFFGVESVDQAVLDKANKRVDFSQVEKVMGWAKQAGLQIRQSYIIGLPGETTDSIEHIKRFVADTEPSQVQFSMLNVFPGTDYANDPESYGLEILPLAWQEFNINIPHVRTADMSDGEILDAYLKLRLSLGEQ